MKKRVAALAQLEACKEQFEIKAWLAVRKKLGLALDPESADVRWQHAQVLDPYGVATSFPAELDQVGREYFARASNGEPWISFDDLPDAAVARLWQRMYAGDFDGPQKRPQAGWTAPAAPPPKFAPLLKSHGLASNTPFFQPDTGAFRDVSLGGRISVHTTHRLNGCLIVKSTACKN
jgi:hypothetical protein